MNKSLFNTFTIKTTQDIFILNNLDQNLSDRLKMHVLLVGLKDLTVGLFGLSAGVASDIHTYTF